MIHYRTGDILADPAEALVNTVNCMGIMGRGIALQFKNAFPENYKAYEAACKRKEVVPGRMFVFENGGLTHPRLIVNFPTKRHWCGNSRMEDIDAGLAALVREIEERHIHSIAIPPLGSGLGGLNWADVRPRIESVLVGVKNLDVVIYEPNGASHAMAAKRTVPKITAGRAALVVLMNRYLEGLLDPFVTLLEVHKLMYFMQEAGQPLRLRYVKGPFGPYAENLRHVLHEMEGHMVAGYADGGDSPDKQLELVPGAVADAVRFLADDDGARERFDRVADLVEGFETPFGQELLSTVHWVVKDGSTKDTDEIIARTYAWNERKKQFLPDQIKLAFEALTEKNWI